MSCQESPQAKFQQRTGRRFRLYGCHSHVFVAIQTPEYDGLEPTAPVYIMSASGSLDNANALSQQEILGKLRERMVAFAASRLQRDATEDLAQEVLILLYEKYPRVNRVDELLPLAMKVLRFKMMAARRKAQRRGEYTQVPVDEMQIAD